jgi:hypothetical protein
MRRKIVFDNEVTENMFSNWKSSPVTKLFNKLMLDEVEAINGRLLDANLILAQGGSIEYAKLTGMKYILYQLIEVMYTDLLTKGPENGNEKS